MIAIGATLVALAFAGPRLPDAEPAYAHTHDGPPLPDHEVPRVGGGALRAGPALQVPWTCGQVEYCTQGHNGGSHTGTSAWAWDFALQEGEEIWAASAGTVTHVKMDSNSGGCDQAFSGQANYITIDHGDGTSIVYLHMLGASTPLAVGDAVEVGDLVARVGETGWACGAHLHMQVMETCGSYYCQSLQASFADYGDPVADTQYDGTNCPACPIALDGTVTTIDDEDAGCFVRQTSSWWSSYEGHADHHFYTLAIDGAASESTAVWRFGVSVPGDYLVEVFVPQTDAATGNAVYRIEHADGSAEVAIDQSTQKDWQMLGTYAFAGDPSEGIHLGDATGESVDLGVRIGFDAVRFTFVPDVGDGSGDGAATAGDDTGGADGVDGSGDDAPTSGDTPTGDGAAATGPGDPDDDAGPDATEGDGLTGSLPPGFGNDSSDGGCACTSDADAPRGLALFVLAIVGIAARRRSGMR